MTNIIDSDISSEARRGFCRIEVGVKIQKIWNYDRKNDLPGSYNRSVD
jgi:hypothetical protein